MSVCNCVGIYFLIQTKNKTKKKTNNKTMVHGVAQLLTEKDIMEIGTTFLMFQMIDSNIGVSAEDSVKTIAKRTLTVIQNRAKDTLIPNPEDNN